MDAGASREVYLPEGKWYDWWDGTVYNGPTTLADYPAPEDKLPLFVKAGAIIPLIEAQQTWKESTMDPMIFRIFPGGDSGFRILGDTLVYPHREEPYTGLETRLVECSEKEGEIQITFGEFSGSFVFEVHLDHQPFSVKRNGMDLPVQEEVQNPSEMEEGWFFTMEGGPTAWIKVIGGEMESNTLSIAVPGTSVKGGPENGNSFSIIPNPLKDTGKVVFELEKSSRIKIDLVDLQGRQVLQLARGTYAPGRHEIELSAECMNREMYLVKYTVNEENNSRLMLVR